MTVTSVTDIPQFKWATVTGNNPLAIQLDGDTAPLALIPDSLVDPRSLSVGDRVRVELSVRKCVVHGSANGGAQWSAGDVKVTAASAAPAGWLLCQGQSLLRTDYPSLFAAIGTTYGSADSTHFTLPNAKGRAVVGLDTSQTEFNTLGKTGGEKTHALSVAELAAHNHGITQTAHSHSQNVTNPGSGGTAARNDYNSDGGGLTYAQGVNTGTANANITINNAGSGTAHNNLQPYITMNYIIKI